MPTPDPNRRRQLIAAARVLGAVAVALVFMFLAWRSSPRIAPLAWMPQTLGRWADHHGIARNVVGFFFFGACFFILVGWRWPQVLLAACFATILEVAQLWIPHRHFDPKDIYASLLGVALAWIVVFGVVRTLRRPPQRC